MNSEAIPLGGNNVNPGQLCETHGIASHNSPPGITPTHGITPSHLNKNKNIIYFKERI